MVQICFRIKNAQNLLKCSLIDISNMPILIEMSKKKKKYLPPVRPKLVPKEKMRRIFSNLAHLIFQISNDQYFNGKNNSYQIILSNLNKFREFFILGPIWA